MYQREAHRCDVLCLRVDAALFAVALAWIQGTPREEVALFRRNTPLLLVTVALAAGCPRRGRDTAMETADTAAPARLVAVTLNTHSFQEGPDSLEALSAIGRGLADLDADVVGLQEVMSGAFWSYDYGGAEHDGTPLVRQAIEERTGETWHATSFGWAHWDTGELMSSVILSRTPLTETDSRALTTTDFWPAPDEQRSVGFARTELEGIGPVHVFVTHPWGWSSADAETQIAEVQSFIVEKDRGDAATLVLGDLNAPSTSSLYARWIEGPPALLDTYAAANPDGFADPTQHDGEHRIDYVLAGATGPLSCEDGACSSRRVFDGTELPVVSDHMGVATTFTVRAAQ